MKTSIYTHGAYPPLEWADAAAWTRRKTYNHATCGPHQCLDMVENWAKIHISPHINLYHCDHRQAIAAIQVFRDRCLFYRACDEAGIDCPAPSPVSSGT